MKTNSYVDKEIPAIINYKEEVSSEFAQKIMLSTKQEILEKLTKK